MSFTTELFIFVFLPLAVLGDRLARRLGWSVWWLIGLSVVFYTAAGVAAALIVLASALTNYLVSLRLVRTDPARQGLVLAGAIAGNLLVLGYFKYFAFLLASLAALIGSPSIAAPSPFLPLGISFFTFQQIAYLLDIRARPMAVPAFRHYLLFVTFFPQAGSGPINYWHDTIPQYERLEKHAATMLDVAVGLTIFAIGLFKKTVFAGSLGQFVDPAFDGRGGSIGFLAAWSAALAFLLQLYFDFSGYTDMAIGIGRLFGIRLPINFNSPYKATSLVDFWRRWHMTMTRFFTDYVYSPLALYWTRQTIMRRDPKVVQFLLSVALPTAVTFVLIGWWHGPQWTYLLFGVVNAIGLIVNQLWRTNKWPSPPSPIAWLMAIGFVMVTVVLFRAPSIAQALAFYHAMIGGNAPSGGAVVLELIHGWTQPQSQGQIGLPLIPLLSRLSHAPELLIYLSGLVFICLFMPNTQEIMARYQPTLTPLPRDHIRWLGWRPTMLWSVAVTAVMTMGIMNISHVKEFIYVNF